MKTGYVALVLALNIGIDPPDNPKTSPCARIECWVDPKAKPSAESIRIIGNALQLQVKKPKKRY